MKNFGSDNAGLFNLVPKEVRYLTSPLVSALADPLDSVVDKI